MVDHFLLNQSYDSYHVETLHHYSSYNHNAESFCFFSYIFVPIPQLERLPHCFVKLRLYEVVSTHLVNFTNPITHKVFAIARSHSKQRASHTKPHTKYKAFYSRSHTLSQITGKDKTPHTKSCKYEASHRIGYTRSSHFISPFQFMLNLIHL